jgi:hypothetical protein
MVEIMLSLDALARLAELVPDNDCAKCRLAHVKPQETPLSQGLPAKIVLETDLILDYAEGDSQNLIFFVNRVNGELMEPVSTRKKRGRKVKEETMLLKKFTSLKGGMPKKEYIRIKVLRGLRKVVRKYPFEDNHLNGINKVRTSPDASDVKCRVAWGELVDFYSAQTVEISRHFAEIEFNERNKEGNFNNEYCRRVLDTPVIRRLYRHYIDFLFADLDPEMMCAKFSIQCCRGCHANECVEKWEELRRYLEVNMLTELGMHFDEAPSSKRQRKDGSLRAEVATTTSLEEL